MNKNGIGIAVIGSGRIGTLRARLAGMHTSVKFLAVSDVDPAKAEALAKLSGAHFHTSDNNAAIDHPELVRHGPEPVFFTWTTLPHPGRRVTEPS